jgi:hypothetical protein
VTSGEHGPTPPRLYVMWYRCVADGHDHAVTDEEFARGVHRHEGRYEAVCGHRVLIGSVLAPPAPPCARCHAYLVARATLRQADERLGRPHHRKPSLWSRLLGPTKPPAASSARSANAMSPERAGRAQVPAGTGCAPIAPAPAGRHAQRGNQ